MKDFKNFLKSEAFFNSRNSDQNLSSLVLAFIKNNYAPKYLKLSLIMFSVLFLPAVNAASANNISILYGWNGTSFVPATITNTGALLTTINMSKSLGLSPEANNTYDLGTAAKLWANLYVRSLRGSGPISIIGDANVTGTLYVTGLVGDGSNLTNIGANLSLNYGYNGTNWLPLATTADGTLKLSVRDSQATNASQLTAGATGTDLTLPGHLIAATANITGGLNVSAGGFNVIEGNVGIGTTSPSEKLTVNGNVSATAYFYTSDIRSKENIATIDGLAIIEKLRGVSFNWKNGGQKSMGLIAQEVETVAPEIVVTDSYTGLKSINYGVLAGPMVEAIKELQKESARKDNRIAELERAVASLRSELDRM